MRMPCLRAQRIACFTSSAPAARNTARGFTPSKRSLNGAYTLAYAALERPITGPVHQARQLAKARIACSQSRRGYGVPGECKAQRAQDERAPVHGRPTYLAAEYDRF